MERIVLRDTVSRDDVDDARMKHGWRLASVIAARAGVPAQQVLLTSDRRHVLQIVEDAQLDVCYVVVTGPDAPSVRRAVEEMLPTVDHVALSRMLAAGEPRALGLAALMCPEPTVEVLRAFDQALVDRKDAVRVAALVAAAYARWPALEARVARVASSDPSPAIRERALVILDAWP